MNRERFLRRLSRSWVAHVLSLVLSGLLWLFNPTLPQGDSFDGLLWDLVGTGIQPALIAAAVAATSGAAAGRRDPNNAEVDMLLACVASFIVTGLGWVVLFVLSGIGCTFGNDTPGCGAPAIGARLGLMVGIQVGLLAHPIIASRREASWRPVGDVL
jgi:hypothetical protein